MAGSQPYALVAFRELLSTGCVSDDVIHRRVPLTTLGQVRVGTVWRDGACQTEIVYGESEKFTVDFTPMNWRLTSFDQAFYCGENPPYPQCIHPLKFEKDKNWLLEFMLPSGGKLIIPCLEFFTRCYGRSAELRRILATYSWEECKEKRLYAPLDEPEELNKWKVKLRKRLVNGDVILLAHAKYDRYTEMVAKNIHAQLEAPFDPGNKAPTFIKVVPWFCGPAELKAKGIWFDEGRSFLALQIVGCSDPKGVPVLRGRDNTNLTNQPADEGSGKLGGAWAGTPVRTLVRPPEIVDLTGEVEPDPHAISVEIEDPAFEVLGEPRVVTDMRKEQADGSAGPKVMGATALAFSCGEAYGTGQCVGYASIHARPVMESLGVMRDMWNAMLFLKTKRPNLIQSVEWFTFEDGYSQETEPKLIRLQPFDENEEVDGTTRKWPYIAAFQGLRGVLLARVVAQGRHVHILEIQRRPRTKKDVNGNVEEVEDSFKGLAFVIDDHYKLKMWLKQLLSDMRYVKGVVQKLAGACPGKAAAFKHTSAGEEEVPCEAAVINALGKMGGMI